MIVDLHCHTTYSDGLLTPEDVVARANQRGVRLLAVTDHDETAGLAEARSRARDTEVELVDGVEISVTWEGSTIHIVGLRINPAHPALTAGLRKLREGRRLRA